MPINANLLAALTPLVNATRNHGYSYANPKSPLIKALEKDGFIEGDANTKNPSDAAQIAYRATEKALAEIPAPEQPAATPAPAFGGTPAPASPDATDSQEAAETAGNDEGKGYDVQAAGAALAAATAPKKRGPRGPRDPNAPPVEIKRSTVRMALPETVKADARRGPRDKYGFADLLPPAPEGYDSFFVAANSHLTNPAKQLGGNVNKANKKFAAGTTEGGEKGRKFKIIGVEKDAEFNVAGARIFRLE